MKTKSLHYCYPTSPGAKGRPRGCWSVEVEGVNRECFATGREAVEFAKTLDFPWQEANLACQCADPETGKVGDWLFVGPNFREPGTKVSPFFRDFAELSAGVRGKWAPKSGTLAQRWSPLP